MTDLISSLADSILAMVNSRSQTPSKAELETLLREHIEDPLERRLDEIFAGATDLNEASLRQALTFLNFTNERSLIDKDDEEAEGDSELMKCTERLLPTIVSDGFLEALRKAQLTTPETYTLAMDQIHEISAETAAAEWERMTSGYCSKHADGHHWQYGLLGNRGEKYCSCGAIKA